MGQFPWGSNGLCLQLFSAALVQVFHLTTGTTTARSMILTAKLLVPLRRGSVFPERFSAD